MCIIYRCLNALKPSTSAIQLCIQTGTSQSHSLTHTHINMLLVWVFIELF